MSDGSGAGYALFLDFDGTLVEIAERPEAVAVAPDLPAILARLRAHLGGALAIVTGRTVEDVAGFLTDPALDICGLHGLSRRVGGAAVRPEFPDLSPEIESLRATLAGWPGVVVESKRIGVAVHWRLAPEAEAACNLAAAELCRALGPGYRLQDGKAVREIVPAGAGKGGGIAALMTDPPYRGRVPVFAGDDRTDESGFLAVNALGGLTVKVGAGMTEASRRVADPEALRGWLRAWSGEAPPPLPAT